MPDETVFREATISTAFNLQGDARHFAVALPAAPNAVTRDGGTTTFWLGPRSWLVFGERLPQAEGGAIFDVSASRVAWTLQGARAVDVLASHCPLDFHASRFPPGTCAQSLFGQVNALYYRHASRHAWTLFVARSFGREVADRLRHDLGQAPEAPLPFVAD